MQYNIRMSLKKSILLSFVLALAPFLSYAQTTLDGPKNDIKVTILSLGSGSSRFTYERVLTDRNSAELTLGVIGWGFDIMNDADPSGLLVKAAYKWNLIPMERANSALAGFYVKPEFVYGNYNYTLQPDDDVKYATKGDDGGHTSQWALMAECGYQLVLGWFDFDIYTGLGPSFGTGNADNYFHSFMLYPVESHVAFTAGFRVGVAF